MTAQPTLTAPTAAPRPPGRRALRFAGHYLEMVAAMVVGMMLLAPLWPDAWTARPDVGALVMAADMTIGMALWMAIRRHTVRQITEMSAAMCAPFVLGLVPYWLGVISGETLMTAAHVLMFLTMLAAMLWRRDEYAH
jgi:flagellar biosynthetic protein FliP